MSGRIRTRATGTMLLSALLVALFVSPLTVAGGPPDRPAAAPAAETADLAAALAADGTFRGASGVAGTVDTSAWTLVSDLAAGEAPRFAPAAGAVSPSVTTAIGPWSALGSNGPGNGALNSRVDALAVSGSDVYVGGVFQDVAGNLAGDSIVSWNGSAWSSLGSNGSNGALNADIMALAVSGPDLYVGGFFVNAAGVAGADFIAKWNGSAWSAVGSSGALNSVVTALTVAGGDLYVGGSFTDGGGVPEADYLARWNGSSWSALGSNGAGNGALNGTVNALAVSGSDLYAGGGFTNAAGFPKADFIARWNGSAWSALGSNGSGNGALNGPVNALATLGSDLYVGGEFLNAAGIPTADFIARWSGSAWSALGSNGSGNGALNHRVRALAVSVAGLYVSGDFLNAAGIPTADFIARWNGSAWSALGSNGAGNGALDNGAGALAVSGTDVYVGGEFHNAAGIPTADFIARWNGSAWSALGSDGYEAGTRALNNGVYALAFSGGATYLGGIFSYASGISGADKIAKWNGSAWSSPANYAIEGGIPGVTSGVLAVAVSGTYLYVGGRLFTDVAGIPTADFIAKWNGSAWSALGSNGFGDGAINGPVYALAVSGTDLYVGGDFTDAGGNPAADYIAKWNVSGWSALGPNGSIDNAVTALAVSGTDLYVGGAFTDAGGNIDADFIAKWSGSGWYALSTLGSIDGALGSSVAALAVSGSNLYVGGSFTNADGIPEADYVARWNGSDWFALGSNAGDGAIVCCWVGALAVSGADVYVGGGFTDAAGIQAADYVAKWNGSAWSALGSNGSGDGALGGDVTALAVSATDLYVGGFFSDAAGIPEADYVAKWVLGSAVVRKPDGRIRKGSGTFVGNNIYNTTGVNQTKTGSAAVGSTITFGISIQNDGNSADSFKVLATGTASTMYTVTYLRGTTDITAAVVAGTYQTLSLAPGATYLITARVKVNSGATVGSSVSRLVTISSVGDSTKKDAVKLIGKRA